MTDQVLQVVHVIDDDDAFRRSLVFLLESAGWAVVAHRSAEVFLNACSHPPEALACLVLDLRMPGISGLELQQILQSRGWQVPIVFITGHGEVDAAVHALKSGANDFLEKPFKDQALLDAVHAAAKQGAEQRALASRRCQAEELLGRLTPRERQVARLVALGLPNKLVARELDISEKTVHIHRQHVMEKTDVNSAAELARLMLRADPGALD